MKLHAMAGTVLGFAAILMAQVGAPTNDLVVHGFVVAKDGSKNGGGALVLANTTTGAKTTVLQTGVSEPVFSPDGSQIAFARIPWGVPSEIWVVNTDGSNSHKVGDCSARIDDGFVLSWTNNNNIWWSQGGNSKDPNMYRLNLDTGVRDVYWSHEPQSADAADGIYKLHVSMDEKWAASMVHGGGLGFTYDLQNKQLMQTVRGGCNGSMSGDGSRYMTGVTQGGYNPDGYSAYYLAGRLYDAHTGATLGFVTVPGVEPYEDVGDVWPQIRDWRFSHHTPDYAVCQGFGQSEEANGGCSYLYEVNTNRYLMLPDSIDPSDFWPGDLPNGSAPPAPNIVLDKSELIFNETNAASPQAVIVSNTVPNTGLTQVTATLVGSPAWLDVIVSGTGNMQVLTVSVYPTGLAAGAHQAQVSVSGGGAAQPALFTVTLNVGSTLNAPGNVSALCPSHGVVDVSWTDNADNETGYTVERQLQGGDWAVAGTVAADVTTLQETGVAPGIYEYRVKAVGTSGESGYSATAMVTVTADRSIVITSPAASVTLAVGQEVVIQWQAQFVDIVNVEYSLDEGETWILINTDDGITASDSRWGNLQWTVPQTAATGVMLKVYPYGETSPVAYSELIALGGAPVLERPGFSPAPPGLHALSVLPDSRTVRIDLVAHVPTELVVLDMQGRCLASSAIPPCASLQSSFWRAGSAGRFMVALRNPCGETQCHTVVIR